MAIFKRADQMTQWKVEMASSILEFFNMTESDNKYDISEVCLRGISHEGMTPKTFNATNLMRHLKAGHIHKYEEFSKLVDRKAE